MKCFVSNSKWAVAAATGRAKTALTRRTPRPVSIITMPTAGTTTMSMFTMRAVDTITGTTNIITKKKSMFITRNVGMTMGIIIMYRKENRVSIKNEIN